MKAVLQRVKEARVSVDGQQISHIGVGILILLAIEKNDVEGDADYLVLKILSLRIFEDENGKMNRSICEVKGELMAVSQFTLLADCRKGNRPSFDRAAHPKPAYALYNYFIERLFKNSKLIVKRGKFAAKMEVHLINDGPVTIILEKQK